MPPKADKLGQSLENLQLFLKRKSDEQENFAAIALELEHINNRLQQKKLTIQIISQNPLLAQALFDLINSAQGLLEFYKLELDPLPEIPQSIEPELFFHLKLESQQENSTQLQQHYQLSCDREYLIGRDTNCQISLDSNTYRGVSWHHASIKPTLDQQKNQQWEICDHKSTNGTFINGKQVQEYCILKSGDKITFGSPQIDQKIAELVFEIQVQTLPTATEQPYWKIIDCDLLFIVIDSQQPLSLEEEKAIKNIDTKLINKQFIVADIPNPKEDQELSKNSDANISELESFLKKSTSKLDYEVIPLFLAPYYHEEQSKELESSLQKQQDRLFKSLETIVKRQPENILAQRLAITALKILDPVSIILQKQQEEINQRIILDNKELETLAQLNFKDAIKKAIAKINEDKDKFFKQVKIDLGQSKSSLLDSFSKHSILYKIQDFIDRLKPVITSRQGYKYVQLKEENGSEHKDVNTSLVNFCSSSLEAWTAEEWDKICHVYGNGGLNNLLEQAYLGVNIIPASLLESPFSGPQNIDVRHHFLASFAAIVCETRLKQSSLLEYIMKQIRANMMQIMMMVTLILPLIGIRETKTMLMGHLSATFKEMPWLFGLVICLIIFMLVNAYQKDNHLKLEEITENLRKELLTYYQSFTKSLLEKVMQDLNLALDYEDKQIVNGLDFVNQTYTEKLLEIERKTLQIKNNLDRNKLQQKSLEKEMSEFNNLKKM